MNFDLNFISATKEIKAKLKQSLEKVQIFGRANFTAAINLAFEVHKRI